MDVGAVLAAQTEMYGEPLGQRFGRLLTAYRISQARLAAVVGLSPPMLSQLMSGRRAKISNPAVLGRLVRLEELAGAVADDGDGREALLEEVRSSRPTLHTGQLAGPPATADPPGGGDSRDACLHALAGRIPPAVLARAATEVSDPELARLLAAAAVAGER